MSVEALLLEVTPFFPHKDENKNVKEETSFFGKLKEAVLDAKNTISEALHLTTSEDTIDSLTKSNEKLVKEVVALREAVISLTSQSTTTTTTTSKKFNPSGPFLIMGDGNMSFSVAFSKIYSNTLITTSVLESKNEFFKRYPSGRENYTFLSHLNPRVNVVFSLDATKIPTSMYGKYQNIIMNFPHHGGKSNLKKSKTLLGNIFKSLKNVLKKDHGYFHLTLAKGQSGLNYDDVLKNIVWSEGVPQHEKDSWQAIYIAAEYGFRLALVSPFNINDFLYDSSGYKNRDQMFHNHDQSVTLTFEIADECKDLEDFNIIESDDDNYNMFHTLRPYFIHDISILFSSIDDLYYWECKLFSTIKSILSRPLIKIIELKHLRGSCPYTNYPNRIYRIYWQGVKVPLTKVLCNKFQNKLRDKLNNVAASVEKKEETADDDFDLFDSDEEEEDEAKKKLTEERLKAYHAKKSAKPGPIAKSSVILDVKPWDDTTDLVKMEECIKGIEKDGLVWGACKQIPLAYGIRKLQIICVIEDLKVSVDDLIEQITTDFEDYVQSVDIAAFNKI
uniref:Elongation factor 1-beta n=1 Tax=Strongyloides stercoralis TaxID=6248 RepID=A0A0K0EQI6_STRER